MKKFKGVLNGVESLLSLFSKRRLGAINPAFGVVEYWSNARTKKAIHFISLFNTPTLQYPNTQESSSHRSLVASISHRLEGSG